jgi:hypothetical protein
MTRSNVQKTPLAPSLARIAEQAVENYIHRKGKALPCRVVAVDGQMVTVAFQVKSPQALPQITIPKNESPWCRGATQIGDTGITQPADTYLGGISGLGGGEASTTQPMPNLTALVFIPVAKMSSPASPDVNKFWGNGPAGAVISTTDLAASVTVAEGVVTIVAGGNTWTFSAAGFTMSTGVVAETHQHSYIPGSNPPSLTGDPVL